MDYQAQLSNLFNGYLPNGKLESANIWKRLEQMENKLDERRSDNRKLHRHLADFFSAGSSSAVTNYVDLKRKLKSTYKEINTLEAKLKHIRIRVTAEREEFQCKFDQQSKALEEREKKHLKKLCEDIENRKTEHKRNVEHLNNELQLVQASIDLEQDEMETQLRRELIDLNSKIWRQQNIAKEVQIKIDDLERRQQAAVRRQSPGHQELQFFQLNQLGDFFAADLESSNAQKSTENVDENEANVQNPETYCADVQASFNKITLEALKSNQNTANKRNKENAQLSTDEPDLRKLLQNYETDSSNQAIHSKYYISPDSQENPQIHHDNSTQKESFKSSLTKISGSRKPIISGSRKPIGSIKQSRTKGKKDDNQVITPKRAKKSSKTAGNVSSLPKRTLSVQKRSSKGSDETIANNPTMQSSDQNVVKKRKLFNVNNLDYLEDLIPTNE